VLENEKAKIYWNVPFYLEKPRENGENKPAVIVHDKETIARRNSLPSRQNFGTFSRKTKYTELRADIKREYKNTDVNNMSSILIEALYLG